VVNILVSHYAAIISILDFRIYGIFVNDITARLIQLFVTYKLFSHSVQPVYILGQRAFLIIHNRFKIMLLRLVGVQVWEATERGNKQGICPIWQQSELQKSKKYDMILNYCRDFPGLELSNQKQ
jgi:hypothetical protein